MKKIFYSVLFFLGLLFSGWVLSYGGENYTAGTNAGINLLSSATDNTLIGNYSGMQIQRGVSNTFLGMYSGWKGFGISGSVKIGYMAGYADSSSNTLFINTGYYPTKGIFGDFSTGYFGINKTPSFPFDVAGIAKADTVRGANSVFTGYLIANGASIFRGGVTVTGAVSSTTTLSATTGTSAGKYLGLTAISTWADTTGWTGIRMFTFTGDSLYVYKANHTINAFAKL